ncbi:MAG: GTP cyclohydrolase II [Rhodobacteraceae bacterium]|nr:GTP cyclohydrolase II [Paracoccaceae bacterium]
MHFSPTIFERIARARSDLRMGLPVVLVDEHGAGAVVLAAETLQVERWTQLKSDFDTLHLAVTQRRAETLKARAYDHDLARILVPSDVDVDWVRSVANPADDLRSPMKGPLRSERYGSATAHRAAIGLCKAARLLPAAVVTETQNAQAFVEAHDLTALPLAEVIGNMMHRTVLEDIVSANLPLMVSPNGRIHVFRPEDGNEEHYAVEIGRPARTKPVLARLHSACFTGDLLGSLKCDCGPQLRGALSQMGEANSGVLLYLNQEGRGIGLANKMRAYALQDQGFDTVEANHRLGFEDDERDFRLGADILRNMGFSEVRLLTNNPAKVAMMEQCGIRVVERVPLQVGKNHFNENYLATKAEKSGHFL